MLVDLFTYSTIFPQTSQPEFPLREFVCKVRRPSKEAFRGEALLRARRSGFQLGQNAEPTRCCHRRALSIRFAAATAWCSFVPGHTHVVDISEAWRGTEESTMPELLARGHLGSLRGNMQRTRMGFEVRPRSLGFN